MFYRNGRLYISETDMNRIWFGSKKPWEILAKGGAVLLEQVIDVDGNPSFDSEGKPYVERVGPGSRPERDVVGIDLMEEKLRFLTDWRKKFIVTNVKVGEKFRIKRLQINGLPPIHVETEHMKRMRVAGSKKQDD